MLTPDQPAKSDTGPSNRKFIFVHIPKTAGSSLKEALGLSWENHKDLARYRREIDEETFSGLFKFTVVRNPWDRLVSDYRFQTRGHGRRASKLHAFDKQGRKRSFEEWVNAAFTNPTAYEPKRWGGEVSPGIHRWSPQVDWIAPEGHIGVDMVIRFEELAESIANLSERLGIPVATPGNEKRMLRRPYPDYYSPSLRDRVGEYYADDVRLFNYTFEPTAERSATVWEKLLVRLRGL